MRHEEELKNIIRSDPEMMETLQVARSLNLPDWWIGAGFVRNKVWDVLHDKTKTPLADIDLLYFDPKDTTAETEKKYNRRLNKKYDKYAWECVNQARVHLWKDIKPYTSSTDALSKWVETATCVAVKLNDQDELLINAPHGLDDLFNLIVRPSPEFSHNLKYFYQRVEGKNWLAKWPKLVINLAEISPTSEGV